MKPDLNPKPENSDAHERARVAIALSGVEESFGLHHAEQSWLALHLESCASCRQFSETSRAAIQSLRGISIAASVHLVSTTQMRVRQRALELQRQQERFWVTCVCGAAVTLSAAFSTALLWLGFGWIGRHAQLSAPVWQSCFVVFYFLPAVIAGILLLSRGTFLADHNEWYQH